MGTHHDSSGSLNENSDGTGGEEGRMVGKRRGERERGRRRDGKGFNALLLSVTGPVHIQAG